MPSNRVPTTPDVSSDGNRDVLIGILALMVDEREARLADAPILRKTEIVLAAAGLTPATIALLLNKKAATVEMTLYRDKQRSAKGAKAVPGEPVA
jgi:hypothetical protein